jgi:hypothetical protein
MIRGTIIFVLVSFTLCVLHSESTAQWVQTGGPPGGGAVCITAGPGGVDLFAGTAGGVFRSTDGGASWSAANKGLPGTWIEGFVIFGPDLFAGTTEGVFRSTDNGATWVESNTGLGTSPHVAVMSLALLGTDLFAGTDEEGVYVSSDSGANWRPVNVGLTEMTVYDLSVSGSSIIAGTVNGIFVSRNRGMNWVESDSGLPKNTCVLSLLAVGPELFAAAWVDIGPHYGQVFRSVDTGKTWTSVNNGLTGVDGIALFANEGRVLAGTDSGVFLSNDRGNTWVPASRATLYGKPIHGFALYHDRVFAAAGESPFSSTDNGETWTPGGPGIIVSQVLTLAKGDGEIFAGTYSGIFRTTDCGTRWNRVDSTLARFEIQSIAVSGTTLLVGTRYGGGFRSTDNGKNWSLVIPGWGDPWVLTFAIVGKNIFAGMNSNAVLRSTDNGVSWTFLPGATPSCQCIAVKGGNLFAGGRYGITRSTDDGMTWTRADTGAGMTIAALAVIGTKIFAGGFGSGVFVSTNNGSRWTKVDSGLTDLVIDCFAVSGNNLFAGTMGGGIFLLATPDTVWTCVNPVSDGKWLRSAGSMNTWITSLLVSDGYLLAGTEQTAAWKRPLSEMVTGVREGGSIAPAAFTLYQNYPNPFNPSTTIKYELPKTSQMSLTVYDILGREVSVLVNDRRNAGVYDVQFDGSALASGVYFCRLQADSYVNTKKLLLLR